MKHARSAPARPWVGMAAVLAAAMAAIGLVAAERAHGLRGERLALARRAADELLPLANGGASDLRINGARIRVTYAAVREGRRRVLDRLADECPGAVERYEDGRHGYLLCRAPAEQRGRFAYVRGDNEGALLVSLQTATLQELARMFPAHGDVPGEDLPRVPRPAGSRRVLSATAVGPGHRTLRYEVPRPIDVVEGEMRDALRREAWEVVATSRLRGRAVLRARRLGRSLDVVLETEGSRSTVTLMESSDDP